jgi:Flp pilus assembly pilin Flp
VRKHLGSFDDEEVAARAYDAAAIEHGLLDKLNFDDHEPPVMASASPAPQQVSSLFRGVSWDARSRNWRVQIAVQGERKHLGGFDDEEAAARAYDVAAIEHGLLDKLNFDRPSASSAPQRKFSRFRGVCWAMKTNKWKAQATVQGVNNNIGYYDDEVEAARAYDEAAIACGRVNRLNFDDYDLSSVSPTPQRGSSRFRGVSWSASHAKWKGQLKLQGLNKHLGRFDNEEGAARAFDKAAIEHGLLDQLNFDDYDLPSASPAPQRVSSRFRGVSWATRQKNWRGKIGVQGEQICLGNFDDEEAAARAYDAAAIEHGLLDQLNFDDYDLPSDAPALQRVSSRFRGVSWATRQKKWKAQIGVNGVQKCLGYFDDEDAAVRAFDEAAIEHGMLDRLNFEHDPEAEALAERAQSRESSEPGELVGCQVKCHVNPHGWCPGVLSEYITKGKFKGRYKVRLGCMYVCMYACMYVRSNICM